ncbi:prepilin-type N-terminal cleavage/methylation domain-containing protein [Nocardioides sp.]|uniref:prepilin-type N-terminal cleavage/methylation domain-containing protein n=1 Tax=Nocardioides sp. TaxID=35761 RepID=UPI002C22815A|nr:prepilin-type N-terminal cleavage/methylation domain-containing protein [Nocardioides sp.]HSX66078.1 prepilin-type N-terminal cleavage/methylation domain-containing protein [Nocardioides sp.]
MALSLDARRKNNDDGFTLIELLIVIIILGILAAVVVFSVNGLNNDAEMNACKAEVRAVETAYEAAIAKGATAPTLAQLQAAPYKFLRSAPVYVTAVDATSVTASPC